MGHTEEVGLSVSERGQRISSLFSPLSLSHEEEHSVFHLYKTNKQKTVVYPAVQQKYIRKKKRNKLLNHSQARLQSFPYCPVGLTVFVLAMACDLEPTAICF